MTNDRYLIVSHFAVAAMTIAFAGTTWLYLRRSFTGITQALSSGNLSRILKTMFPVGLFLPAFLGFLSVSYRGCGKSYEDIVKERSYLVQINQEQISSPRFCFGLWPRSCSGTLVILFALRFARTSNQSSGESPDIRLP